LGAVLAGLKAIISGGAVCSLPGQKGQKPAAFLLWEGEMKSEGLLPLSTDMMTHLPDMGSFLNSGMFPPHK
jgi:hypothetical protein